MKSNKPKIFHIGGSHSVHVADLVNELDKLGYPQCVLSYRKENLISKHVPVYVFNYQKFYPNKSFPSDEQALRNLISTIIKKEKPDILHGHFLIFCCVALGIAKDISNLPTFLSPWSTRALAKDTVLLTRIDQCIKGAKAFLTDKMSFFTLFQSTYTVNLKDHMYQQFRLPLDLSVHHNIDIAKKDFTIPKILSARVMGENYHQELLVRALPEIFKKYNTATATFIIGQSTIQGKPYFVKMVELAKSLGIFDKCNFIARGLTQEEFSNLICSHNIVYSVCEDPGCAQTTIQAAYTGAVTIVRHNPLENGILDHNVNVMKVHLKVQSIINSLDYSIANLPELGTKLFYNNRKLREYSTEYTLPKLTALYNMEFKH